MQDWINAIIEPDASLSRAIEVIDRAGRQICLVTDADRKLLGTLSDGDVRRALIRGMTLETKARQVMNLQPRTMSLTDPEDVVLAAMREHGLHQMPILDLDGRVAGLATIDDFMAVPQRDEWVVIMAGGKGTRLGELTRDTPKPMLKVGSRPLLETIIQRYVDQGFRNFYLSVNYKADQIEGHFGDGSRYRVNIRYLRESSPLGTAGSLSLIEQRPETDLIVCNGDLLTTENFGLILAGHRQADADATMLVREYEMQVPFGVVDEVDGKITTIREKPVLTFQISAGMYVLSPQVLELVPVGQYFDMPSLFNRIIESGLKSRCHQLQGYWMDVGRLPDFERANSDFSKHFS